MALFSKQIGEYLSVFNNNINCLVFISSLETYSGYGNLNFTKVQEARRQKCWAAKVKKMFESIRFEEENNTEDGKETPFNFFCYTLCLILNTTSTGFSGR